MKKQKGYSQIEVLVSVLVLAIGILGMGGLQAKSLQNSQNSVLRTQAAYLSYEILDRMRANLSAAKGGSYDSRMGGTEFGAEDCATATAECSAAQLAAYDLKEWKCSVGVEGACGGLGAGGLVDQNNGLPLGDASIAFADDKFTITLRWDESRANDREVEDYETYSIITAL